MRNIKEIISRSSALPFGDGNHIGADFGDIVFEIYLNDVVIVNEWKNRFNLTDEDVLIYDSSKLTGCFYMIIKSTKGKSLYFLLK